MEVNGEDDLAALAASFNQMAENLQRHILRLEEMSRLQRRFTSDVSHELRTPLTTVRMAADLIFSDTGRVRPAPVARSAELLQAELDRFESLLAELLEISRFDAGFAALDAEPANVAPLISGRWTGWPPVAERAGVEVEVDLPTEPVVAEVDVRRVERDPAQPHRQRDRAQRGPADQGPPGRARGRRRRSPCATTGWDSRPARRSLSSTGSGGATRRAPGRPGAPVSGLSISIEDARLHGGWLEAWGAPGAGCPVPADPAGTGRRPAGLLPAAAGADRLQTARRRRARARHRRRTGCRHHQRPHAERSHRRQRRGWAAPPGKGDCRPANGPRAGSPGGDDHGPPIRRRP